MKKLFSTLFILISLISSSQTPFLSSGKIEFEKKLNIQKETEDDHWLDNLRDKIPKYRTSYNNLYFIDEKTFYEKCVENNEKIPFMQEDKRVDDIIYTDLKQGIFYKKQAAFDETFLVSDSIRFIKWQMTNDLRDIAGFECHKAVGKILDSIFVVAFYTDQIKTSGGPLSFCNLPGMILGIAIPRSNLTIFATKVEMMEPKIEKFNIPTGKMKKTDYKGLTLILQKALSDWGNYGKKYIINSLL